jgi:MoaA/NifB/PqqE/SkfB family radical SAM enzyme
MDLPSVVQIEPVGQCNLRCRMCPIEYRPESAHGQPPALLPQLRGVFGNILMRGLDMTGVLRCRA